MTKYLLKSASLALFSSLLAYSSAHAASSEWQDLGGGEARLIANLNPSTNEISGAIEVKLEPGWSTYWRYPGSSGIPPHFDFSRSQDFQNLNVHFPAPKLIKHEYGAYAGYKNKVIFPFNGKLDGGTSGKIDLKLLIGVCSDICIPAQAEMSINVKQLMQSDPRTGQIVQFANFSVPVTKPAEDIILSTARKGDKELHIEVAHKSSHGEPSLFVEGPQDWYLKPATLVSQQEDRAVFALDISRAPKDAQVETQRLRYTLVTGKTGIETTR